MLVRCDRVPADGRKRIENGVTDLSDLMLKDRIAELKAIRDQARADAERAEGAIDRLGPTITTQSIKAFARTARKRMRTESGGYRRHLALGFERNDFRADVLFSYQPTPGTVLFAGYGSTMEEGRAFRFRHPADVIVARIAE